MKKTIKQKTVITLASLGLACSSVVVFANTAKAKKYWVNYPIKFDGRPSQRKSSQ